MRLTELQDVLRKQPFEPFRIVLTTGDSYEIRHPELAWLTRTSMFVGIPLHKDTIADRAVQCDLLHIVAIEPVNGRRRGARSKPRGK
jgi:hypothetical protein